MRLISMTIANFRAYGEERSIKFDDITTIIGRNDVGKSTILEALEIFFNNDTVKIDSSDPTVWVGSNRVAITAEFDQLPSEITLDAGAPTNLSQEYLLTSDSTLMIRKLFDCSKTKPSVESFIVAEHPTANGVENLLELKEKELQALVKEKKLEVALKGNPGMRQALWASVDDLKIGQTFIPVSKTKEDTKRIWEQIELHLPMFVLFQSDRQSKESDGEVQNPLKGAISAAIAEVQNEIEAIQNKVREKSEEIVALTHAALQSIDSGLANSLTPTFIPPTSAKWTGLFSIGMDTDESIPLNKRGSGVRRLILVSFFKAEAERRLRTSEKANIIYAIEEPETSQHPNNQKILMESLIEIANVSNTQVIVTTHSPGLAADLPVDSIRFISSEGVRDTPDIFSGVDVFDDVANALGLVPDSRVKVLICLEGPLDVIALCELSRALNEEDATIPSIGNDPRCAFVTLGGSTLKSWVDQNYLRGFRCPEVHIYDGDVGDYADAVAKVNSRQDGFDSWAVQTQKHEIESYLHADAINEEFGVQIEIVDHPEEGKPAVPSAFGIAYAEAKGRDTILSDRKAKKYLSRAFKRMTAERVRERDPNNEIENWLRQIAHFF